MKRKAKKCIVLFSGGLDSRLAMKLMQKQGFEIIAVFFKLPFGEGCCNENCSFNFSQIQGVELKVFDCTKGKLLREYLQIIKEAKHGRGAGFNPCIDCRIFMLKKVKKFADKQGIDLIVTGEVLGERPLSQRKKALEVIEKESDLQGRLLRPLSAKLLSETNAEKKGFVNRNKLLDIKGRNRKRQIALAKKFKISYPSPAGGCLLCEKQLKKRFEYLIEYLIKNGDENEIPLVKIGRHFLIPENHRFSALKTSKKSERKVFNNNFWVVIGRNEQENKIIENIGRKKGSLIIPKFPGPSAIILNDSGKGNEKIRNKVNELIKAYSRKGSLEDRKKFEKYKL